MSSLPSPATWAMRRLGDPDVALLTMGQSPASSSYNSVGTGLPFYQGKADFGLRHPVPRVWCTAPARFADSGDVLVSVRAPVGDVNIATERCCIGRGIASVRASTSTMGEYLFFVLMAYKDELDRMGSGAIFRAINKDTLYTFEIPVPPVAEQRAIASVLSRLLDALDIEDRRVAALKELKAATMARVLSEGLRGEGLGQTVLGERPTSWRVLPLGSIAKIGNGSTPSRQNPAYWDHGSIPWITSTKVHNVFIRSADEFVTDLAFRECHLPLVPKGSVVIAITGQGKTLGNAAITLADTCINQHLAFAEITSRDAVAEFILYYLQARYADLRSVGFGGGSTKGALTCGFLKTYPIPLPTVGEQREIVGIIGKLSERIEVAMQRRRALSELFSTTLEELMTGTLRVTPLLKHQPNADA